MKTVALMPKALGAFFHTVADFARTAPENVWAMCAFVAAGSMLVTIVTRMLPAATNAHIAHTLDGALRAKSATVWKNAPNASEIRTSVFMRPSGESPRARRATC